MFRICVIGCGPMAVNGHGPAFAKYKADYTDVVLGGCCDIDAERAEVFRTKFGFERAYTDYEAMLDAEKPDVVSLLLPPRLTCPVATSVMQKGFHVILEKPPAENGAQIREMARVAREMGVSVRTAFNRRYMPLIVALLQRVRATGESPLNITCQFYRYKRHDADFSTTAIHAIDLVKYIAGADFASVTLDYQPMQELGENVKNIYASGRFENGTAFQIAFVPVGGAVIERITVNCHTHTFFVELPVWNNLDVPGRLTHVHESRLVDVVHGDTLCDSTEMFEVSGFYNENRLYFEELRSKKEQICDLESTVQSVELEDCIRHSVTHYGTKEP